MDYDKNSFVSHVPFSKRQAYLWWLKITGIFLTILVLVLAFVSLFTYQRNQKLLSQQAALLQITSQLDEVVRKKNKLLAQENNQNGNLQKKQGMHAKIADYLLQIEQAMLQMQHVYLTSFEFTPKKIELTGYSKNIKSVSDLILNLQQLDFVKNHELAQVSQVNHKLAFTLILEI
jgi:Tfp pilus assembly protein PilN